MEKIYTAILFCIIIFCMGVISFFMVFEDGGRPIALSSRAVVLRGMALRKQPLACTMEAKLCPDGVTYVGRSSQKNCRFDSCPGENH